MRQAAVKRRRKGVEFLAGLRGESTNFFLYRKRNPLREASVLAGRIHQATEEAVNSCLPLNHADTNEHSP